MGKQWNHGLSSVRTTNGFAKQLQSITDARYGPKVIWLTNRFSDDKRTKTITEPRSVGKQGEQTAPTRHAPIRARNFRSPRTIASRGMTSSRYTGNVRYIIEHQT